MTENNHDQSALEQRLRAHYGQRYESLPSPSTIWARVQPELEQQQDIPAPMFPGRFRLLLLPASLFATLRHNVFVREQEREALVKNELEGDSSVIDYAHSPQREQKGKRRLIRALEVALAASIVASLVLGWFAITRGRNAQGNASALLTYESQPHEGVYDLGWTPDGKQLVFALSTLTNHYRYLVWDSATRKTRQTLSFSLPSSLPGSASAPDGNLISSSDEHYLLIATYGGTKQIGVLKLANILTGQVKLIYQGVYPGADSLALVQAAFSPNNKEIAFLGADRRIHIWDIAANSMVLTSDASGLQAPASVHWSVDGKRIVLENIQPVKQHPATVQIWDARSGHKLINIVETPNMSLFFLPIDRGTVADLSPDETRILTYNLPAGTFEERDSKTLRILHVFHIQLTQTGSYGNAVTQPFWLANGTRIFLLTNGTTYIWNAATGQLLSTFSAKNMGAVRPQPFGQYILLQQNDNRLVVRNAMTGENIRTITPAISGGIVFWWPSGNDQYQYINVTDGRNYGQIYNALNGKLIVSYQGDFLVALAPQLLYIAIPHTANDPQSGAPLQSSVEVLPISH